MDDATGQADGLEKRTAVPPGAGGGLSVGAAPLSAAAAALGGEEVVCPHCGYDLRAIDSRRCPECGREVDRSADGVSTMGWARARWRTALAFWATVMKVTFRPGAIALDLVRPVDVRQAKAFWRWTVSRVWAAVVLPPLVVWGAFAVGRLNGHAWYEYQLRGAGLWWLEAMVEPETAPIELLGLSCLVVCAMGLIRYGFILRDVSAERRARVLALSYYACAPFVLFIPVALVMWMIYAKSCYVAGRMAFGALPEPPWIVAGLVAVACMVCVLRYLKALTQCGLAWCVGMGVAWVVGTAGLAVVWLVGLPLAVNYVRLIWRDF